MNFAANMVDFVRVKNSTFHSYDLCHSRSKSEKPLELRIGSFILLIWRAWNLIISRRTIVEMQIFFAFVCTISHPQRSLETVSGFDSTVVTTSENFQDRVETPPHHPICMLHCKTEGSWKLRGSSRLGGLYIWVFPHMDCGHEPLKWRNRSPLKCWDVSPKNI